MKVRCNIKMIRYVQVDVEIKRNASSSEKAAAIKEQAEREFGGCDQIKVLDMEAVEP